MKSKRNVVFFLSEEYPTAPYEEILRAAGVQGLAPCPEPVRLPGDPCRPNQKPIAFRPATITKIPKTGERCGMYFDKNYEGCFIPNLSIVEQSDKTIEAFFTLLHRVLDGVNIFGALKL